MIGKRERFLQNANRMSIRGNNIGKHVKLAGALLHEGRCRAEISVEAHVTRRSRFADQDDKYMSRRIRKQALYVHRHMLPTLLLLAESVMLDGEKYIAFVEFNGWNRLAQVLEEDNRCNRLNGREHNNLPLLCP